MIILLQVISNNSYDMCTCMLLKLLVDGCCIVVG